MYHGTILSLFNTGHNYNISLVTAQFGVEFLSLRVTEKHVTGHNGVGRTFRGLPV